jgi:fumarate hydratase subunit alpha
MIDEKLVGEVVAQTFENSSVHPSRDGLELMQRAYHNETDESAKKALETILRNIELAGEKHHTLCQTYATPAIFVELGTNVRIKGDFREALRNGCRLATKNGYLRPSIVEPLTRKHIGGNVGSHVPDIDVEIVGDADFLRITTYCTTALPPSFAEILLPSQIGKDSVNITRMITEKVIEGGGMLCPPICVGVGIGGSLSTAAKLSKYASLRGWTTRNSDPQIALWEADLLDYINRLGIGPFGLGGDTTALAVNIEISHAHSADLPVSAEYYCWACSLRRASAKIDDRGKVEYL